MTKKLYAQSSAGFIGWVSYQGINEAVAADGNNQHFIADVEPGNTFWVEVGILGYGAHKFTMPDHDTVVEFYGTAFNPGFQVRKK